MSIFKSALSWFKKIFANQTPATLVSEAHAAQVALNLLAPGVILVLKQAGKSEASAEVASVSNEVVTDLGTVSALLAQAQGGADVNGQIIAALDSVKTNLSGLLASGHIKDPNTLATVTNVSNALIAEIEVVISEFATAKVA
jgi:hypothetical protein